MIDRKQVIAPAAPSSTEKSSTSVVSGTGNTVAGVRHRHHTKVMIQASPSCSASPLHHTSSALIDILQPPASSSSSPSPLFRRSPSRLFDMAQPQSGGNRRKRRGGFACCRATKWSLSALLVVVLIISSICSIVVSTMYFWWWTWSHNQNGAANHLQWHSAWPRSASSSQSLRLRTTRSVWSPWSFFLWGAPKVTPRVFYLGGQRYGNPSTLNVTVDGTMMHSLRSDENDAQDDWQPIDYEKSTCKPLAAWQTQSFPTCNTLHEIQLHSILPEVFSSALNLEEELVALGQGWFRTTWRWDRNVERESLVLKTLRLERAYKREYYELHRRDAVAMERLTASPFVVNVYGSCGNSAINELADFPFENVQSLESFNRRMRGRDDSAAAYMMKLRVAASIAVGLADIHGIDFADRPTMTHYDLNPRNVAMFVGGKPKINDFNIAEFLHYDPATNKTCGFPSRLHEPWWRAPEEMNTTSNEILVDEKVDIYALGNIFFHTLTTHSPRGKMVPPRMDAMRSDVAAGIPPIVPLPYSNTTDPAGLAILHAMEMCFKPDAKDRASAATIADYLTEELLKLTRNVKTADDEQEQKEIATLATKHGRVDKPNHHHHHHTDEDEVSIEVKG